jgi:hypothetical protein
MEGVQQDKLARDASMRRACLEYCNTMAAAASEAGVHYSTMSMINFVRQVVILTAILFIWGAAQATAMSWPKGERDANPAPSPRARVPTVLSLLTKADADASRATATKPQAHPAIRDRKPRPAVARRWSESAQRAGKSASLATAAPSLASGVIPRTSAPVTVVTGTAPGQAGYVHYFTIKAPNDEEESHIGIELDDQRIAWSFPRLGVVVSPFIENGSVAANGIQYRVQHSFGFRPFPDDESMRELQAELSNRVVSWVDDEIPYCYSLERPPIFCVSCLGFVMRILFPGSSPAYPSLPRDFDRGPRTYYTTDDLLLYLVGLHGLGGKDARLKRAEALNLPDVLREEVIRLVSAAEANDNVAAGDVAPPPQPATRRPAVSPAAKSGRRPALQGKGS